MKKLSKILATVTVSVLTLVMCISFAACGGSGYTVEVDGMLSEWEYNFVNILEFGEEDFGMINIEKWGNKKLKCGADNLCIGVGCKWSVKLELNGDKYDLYVTAHLIGNDTVYAGEGDYTYMFEGAYSDVSDDANDYNSYKLEAPDYVKVSLDGNFELVTEGYDFADYIPSAPWEIDSDTPDDDPFVTGKNDNSAGTRGLNDKLHPSKLIPTVFGGATFNVKGNSIVSVTDPDFPM